VESVLDLGCGAGAVGLLLARAARRVVATDVSPRALALARLNATLNGVRNVELRQGDLFEPVHGETYDRIAVHPPFLARRDGAPTSPFAYGGRRGDELSLRMLAGIPSHLAPAGRGLLLADWPLVSGDLLEGRIRSAIGAAPADILILQSPPKNLDEYCVMHLAVECPELGERFVREAIAQRDHLERLGLRGLAMALVVVEPTAERGWTSLLAVRHGGDAPLTEAAVDRLVEAHRLSHRESEVLEQARLKWPDGAARVEQPLPDGRPPAIVVQLPAGRPEWPVVLEGESAAIVERIAGSPTVGDAARRVAAEQGRPLEEARGRVDRVVRDALRRGALDVV
jgi:SAM-dependent methyltransferase